MCLCAYCAHACVCSCMSVHMQIHQQATVCGNIREGPVLRNTPPLVVTSKVIGL